MRYPKLTGAIAMWLVMSTAVFAASDLNPVTMYDPPTHDPVALVKARQPLGEIVQTIQGRQIDQAVRDLQTHIEMTTGAKLPIVKQASGRPAIIVGDSDVAASLDLVGEKMPIEGFAIRTAPNVVLIVGHGEAGTSWGVYEFLERFVNVRWYWPNYKDESLPTGTSIIPSDDLIIKPVSLTDAPVFRKRHRWPSGGPRIGQALMSVHDARLRSASSWPIELIVHAPHDWASLYKDSRPQIFQLRSDGQRDFSMLDYAHPLTLQTYLEEIEYQRSELAAGRAVPSGRTIIKNNVITVSPADLAISSFSDEAKALWDPDGGQYGTASRIMGTFVAKLGDEVKKRWPDMTIVFLPYKNYTYAPMGITFPDNVEVQICGMPGLAQYKDPVINMHEQANIDAWVKISGRRIQNWHYSCWPADRTKAAYLFPNVAAEHYRANRDKTVGTFINGIADHWPRQHLSLYVWLKALWNPDINVQAIIDEYCKRMYGPASDTMHQLVTMLIDGWEKSDWPGNRFSPKAVYEASYPRENVITMEALLDKAFEQAKGDELVTARLKYYEPSLRAFFAESKQYAEGTGIRPLDVMQVVESPTIDGKLDDPQWQGVEAVPFVMATNKDNPTPRFTTTLKGVWSRQGVTFGFRMSEPDVKNLKADYGPDSRDGSNLWWDDNVEIFLDVTGERADYYQLIINSRGAIMDAHAKDTSWTAKGVVAANQIGDDYWTVEVFIPYSAFEELQTPASGVAWYGNFTRHRVIDRSDREYQRFNTTFAGPSNDQNAFGPIRFIER